MILALAGGVGGAKLALGLSHALPPGRLAIVVNTGDDFVHLGLHVSPDLDTVMYTLAGLADCERGWGLAGESWAFMEAVRKLGGEDWFQLGDRDLATHVLRTRALAAGESLSAVTQRLCARLGIAHPVIPMSDDPVRTMIRSGAETLAFQDWFVRLRCGPPADAVVFEGAAAARPSPGLDAALARPDLEAIILCPSNPFVSVAPILALPGVRDRLHGAGAPIVAVSPIVGGAAIKGPAAKMMAEQGLEVSALGIARHYRGLADGLIIDAADAALAPAIEAAGLAVHVCGTVMVTLDDRVRLAADAVAFAARLGRPAR